MVRAVLAVQPELERVAPGQKGAAFPLAVAFGRLERVDLGDDGVEGGAGVLIVGVKGLLAVLDARNLGFEGGELAVGLPAALLPCPEGFTEPAEFGLGGLDPGACGAHLPGQFGQALAAVRGGPEQGCEPLVLGGGGVFGVLLGCRGGVQGAAAVQDLALQPGLLLPDAGGLPVELLGVAAGIGGVIGSAEQPAALLGQRAQRAQPFPPGGELVPGVAGGVELWRGVGGELFKAGLPLPAEFEFLPDDAAAGLERSLVRHILGQGLLQLHQVVREEAGARVTDLELDGLGAAGHFGLFAQRRELPADLAGEVAEPGEVGLHGFEFADRLFLAAAVFEDAGGFFDEAPPVLRGGVEHLVQLALPDDHVHFPAQAGVGEEFLDVQEPAAGAVDGVLRAAGAEQRAGNRDFAVLDRQGAVAVVNGE